MINFDQHCYFKIRVFLFKGSPIRSHRDACCQAPRSPHLEGPSRALASTAPIFTCVLIGIYMADIATPVTQLSRFPVSHASSLRPSALDSHPSTPTTSHPTPRPDHHNSRPRRPPCPLSPCKVRTVQRRKLVPRRHLVPPREEQGLSLFPSVRLSLTRRTPVSRACHIIRRPHHHPTSGLGRHRPPRPRGEQSDAL